MVDDELAAAIRAIVRDAVQAELQDFRDREIAPLRQAHRDLARRLDQLGAPPAGPEFELPPPLLRGVQSMGLGTPRSTPPAPVAGSAPPSSKDSSPSLLHRVGSKVVATTSSLLGASPEIFPFDSLGSHGSPSHDHGGGTPGPDLPLLTQNGPITVRRNSGMSRTTSDGLGRGPTTSSSPAPSFVGSFGTGSLPGTGAPANAGSLVGLTPDEVPRVLEEGLIILRITHNKKVQRTLRVHKEAGMVSWNTKQSSRLYIDRIAEIYVGQEARNYREEFRISAEYSSRWATIIHQRRGETKCRALHLIIANQSDFDAFITTLFRLVKFRRDAMSGLFQSGPSFANAHWGLSAPPAAPTAASTAPGARKAPTFAQVQGLARQLHINCSRHYLRAKFDEADKDHSGSLDFEEFQEFVRLLKERSDIAQIYADHQIGASPGHLLRFWRDVQGEEIPPASAIQLPLTKAPSLDEFTEMLLAKEPGVEAPLTFPLSQYLISSSHNTYLTGRQVADGSSIEACIRALQDGCRCIELDCWDGPAHSASPVVYHGHGLTRLTSSVVFADVIDAVLKYAFISSPYPLILSLEIRCSEASQIRIVSILRTVLAGLLVTEPLQLPDTTASSGVPALPSPEQLKHRILIKVKNSHNSLADSSSSDESSDSLLATSTNITPALAELGVYFSGRKFSGYFTGTEPPNTVYSFSEKTIKSLAKDPHKREALVAYNQDHFSRVYPGAFRLKSSNFDPIAHWKLGVQMAAINWQTFDLGMQINSAFFSSRVGYTLRPPPSTVLLGGEPKPVKLEFEIVSAQQLPRPRALKDGGAFSPYVVLEIFGTGSPETSNLAPQWKTSAAFDNGFNPIWNHKCSITISAADYEYACVRFTLVAEGQAFAYHIARVATMPRGYRHVPLVDPSGEEFIFSSLFIKNTRHDCT